MTERIDTLQERSRAAGVDLVVLNPGASLTYLTGHAFEAHERLFLLLVPADGTPVAILPLLEKDNWASAVPQVERLFLWDDKDGFEEAAGAACAQVDGARTVAIEPLGLRYMEYSVLERHLPGREFVSAAPIIGAMRRVKSALEADAIRRAARIAEDALEETLRLVRPGVTEKRIAAALSSRLLAKGGETISFGPIVLGGPKSALPHGVPDERPVGSGELLLIDFGTAYEGYHCDITRTFVVGAEPDECTRDVYEAVRAGNAAGCAAACADATAHQVHTAAQAPLLQPRFSEFLTHRTGHGLGLDIHEPPSVMEGNHDPLGVGTVITVEPGLYLKGWGGVRIEDDIWVTAEGPDSLTRFPRGLRVVGT